MPMSTQSVPHLREPAVAEAAKKSTEKPVVQPAPPAPKLAPAAASGNAEVQILLAHRSIHASNGDAEKLADIDGQLAELGFTAQ